jgi:hypothetical protein
MGVIVGVLIGYVIGSRSGEDAWSELKEAWKTIVSSDEVRDLVAGGLAMVRDIAGRQARILASALGVYDPDPALRRAA